MAEFDYDLFVIGGGSGGVRAARMAAETGATVGIAEEHRFGGTCVIRGCVPKKLLVYASQFPESFENAAGYGWTAPAPSFDWGKLIDAKNAEIGRLENIYARNLAKSGVELHRCRAELRGPHEVCLLENDRLVSAKHILIAVGGAPFVPDVEGAHHAITSNEAFDLPTMPRDVVIVGGGYIACEFAGIFNGLGAHVELCYRGSQILRGFDDDLRGGVAEEMRKKGVLVHTGEEVSRIERDGSRYRVTFERGHDCAADMVMYATGRRPNTKGLGLEEVGVELGRGGAVVVDEYSQTTVPSIYAIGDVTDRIQLTPVAIREGAAFVETVFRGEPTTPEHACVPSAVFTHPELGTVGLTEAEARAETDVEIYRTVFTPMLHTLSGRDEKMLMKLVVEKGSRKVLGVHIMGHAAAEMIQLAGIAVKMGATKDDFDRTVAVHPTAAEELVTLRTPVA